MNALNPTEIKILRESSDQRRKFTEEEFGLVMSLQDRGLLRYELSDDASSVTDAGLTLLATIDNWLTPILKLAQERFYRDGDHHQTILAHQNDDGSKSDIDDARRRVQEGERDLNDALRQTIKVLEVRP